jgi:putative addiction module killer protein
MIELVQSTTFAKWLAGLKDKVGQARVKARLDRLALGHPGDVKPVREGVSELRIDHGPGYRVYFQRRGTVLILLLAGGDKSTQATDITHAIRIAQEWKD